MTLCEIARLWPTKPDGTLIKNREGVRYTWDQLGGWLYFVDPFGLQANASLISIEDLTDDTWEFVPLPLWARKFGRIT